MAELTKYTLGSGHIHYEAYTGALPADWDAFFASQTNLLGRVKSGASFEYTTEKYEDEDDLGYVVIEDITKEKVIMKSGIMTWDNDLLSVLGTTARVTTSADGTSTCKLGGLANQTDTRYVIGFEHKSKKLRVIIVARNTAGFTFDFKQDSATVINTEFRAEANDSEGTLLIIQDMRNRPELATMTIGTLTLTPTFDGMTTAYTAATTNATDVITATAADSTATVLIKNGTTTVASGAAATWTTGANTVTVTVTKDTKIMTYVTTVTKSGT